MTKEEMMSKNINLSFDFIDYLIKNPSEIEKIPNGCTIIFEDSAQGNINEIKLKNANVLTVRIMEKNGTMGIDEFTRYAIGLEDDEFRNAMRLNNNDKNINDIEIPAWKNGEIEAYEKC